LFTKVLAISGFGIYVFYTPFCLNNIILFVELHTFNISVSQCPTIVVDPTYLVSIGPSFRYLYGSTKYFVLSLYHIFANILFVYCADVFGELVLSSLFNDVALCQGYM